MTTMTITLIVAIVVAITLYSVTLREIIKKGYSGKRIARLVLPLGLLFIIYLSYNLFQIEPADWAQIMLTFGLVGVTIFYAFSAARQADASVKMAKEMKEQRLSEAQPHLLLRLEGDAVQWDEIGDKKPSSEFSVIIRNEGKGTATNLRASLWNPTKNYFYTTKGYLAPGEEWRTLINRTSNIIKEEIWLPRLKEVITQPYPGIVAVKCQDIHKHNWVSYLCLETIDESGYVQEEYQDLVKLEND